MTELLATPVLATTPKATRSSRGGSRAAARAFLATCNWCRELVQVLPSIQATLMPLDLSPDSTGRVAVTATGVALVLTGVDIDPHPKPLWRSHYATCRQAYRAAPSSPRRLGTPGGGRVASRQSCPAPSCGEPLALALLLIGEASHPCCRPAGADRGLVAGSVSSLPHPDRPLPALAALDVIPGRQVDLFQEGPA